ncbi:MAG TPA: ribosomal RNA small subunit methyltransferase A [Myxococcales bacterium]|nr:ribosomal RNA small subunit methyltransferase A [Myxococcales bacterium]HIN85780.1 ribosomal RNA small subunit methyltransferase A [Myxococcales bacterium]
MKAKKSFGQHFLHDGRVLQAIVNAAAPREGELVVEIGPGTGQLTKRLAAQVGVQNLRAVEADRDMVAHLATKMPELEVVQADAARFEWETLIHNQPAVIVGNLPYNASTAILFHLLLNHRHRFRRMIFMFQREVAERLRAGPGGKTFGPPSVLSSLLAKVQMVVKVPPGAFRPPPKVDSAVLSFEPREQPLFNIENDQINDFNDFVHALFRQRRKTVLNNLKRVAGQDAAEHLNAVDINPMARAETLEIESLVELWRHVLGEKP